MPGAVGSVGAVKAFFCSEAPLPRRDAGEPGPKAPSAAVADGFYRPSLLGRRTGWPEGRGHCRLLIGSTHLIGGAAVAEGETVMPPAEPLNRLGPIGPGTGRCFKTHFRFWPAFGLHRLPCGRQPEQLPFYSAPSDWHPAVGSLFCPVLSVNVFLRCASSGGAGSFRE